MVVSLQSNRLEQISKCLECLHELRVCWLYTSISPFTNQKGHSINVTFFRSSMTSLWDFDRVSRSCCDSVWIRIPRPLPLNTVFFLKNNCPFNWTPPNTLCCDVGTGRSGIAQYPAVPRTEICVFCFASHLAARYGFWIILTEINSRKRKISNSNS